MVRAKLEQSGRSGVGIWGTSHSLALTLDEQKRAQTGQSSLGDVGSFVAGAAVWAFFGSTILAIFGLGKKAAEKGVGHLQARLNASEGCTGCLARERSVRS